MSQNTSLTEHYREEIRGWDWERLKADALRDGVDLENSCAWVFLGTVMNLTPSGKFYTPWACSNVEVCPPCSEALDGPCTENRPCETPSGWIPSYEGEVYHCEICRDAAFYAALEGVAKEHNMWLESGEGDPCDLFAVMSVDKQAVSAVRKSRIARVVFTAPYESYLVEDGEPEQGGWDDFEARFKEELRKNFSPPTKETKDTQLSITWIEWEGPSEPALKGE